MEIRFEGSKGGQGRKGAALVRTRNVRERGEGASGEGGAVELLGELFGMFKGGEMPEAAPLTTFWNGTK